MNTLIESGGGNRPCDARQPSNTMFDKVLIPTDPRDLKDKGRNLHNMPSSYEEGFSFPLLNPPLS